MPVYIVLLRGINIGPHKRMKMEKLVASCAACGYSGAKTYIQSGNVVLKAARMPPEKLSKKLEAQIAADFGFSADVISRTKDELGSIIKNNPWLKESAIASEKLHVLFLLQAAPSEAIKKLQSVILPPDRAVVAKKEIYFYFPNGVSGSSLWKHPLDRVLQVSNTMRNWNTVSKLFEMAEELE
jgi:uncharacterized protein (DUF1697 family)